MLCLLISHIESRIRIGPSSPEWLSCNKSLYVVVFTPFPFDCVVSTIKQSGVAVRIALTSPSRINYAAAD